MHEMWMAIDVWTDSLPSGVGYRTGHIFPWLDCLEANENAAMHLPDGLFVHSHESTLVATSYATCVWDHEMLLMIDRAHSHTAVYIALESHSQSKSSFVLIWVDFIASYKWRWKYFAVSGKSDHIMMWTDWDSLALTKTGWPDSVILHVISMSQCWNIYHINAQLGNSHYKVAASLIKWIYIDAKGEPCCNLTWIHGWKINCGSWSNGHEGY